MSTKNAIVVAVDGSPASQTAVRWAAAAAAQRRKTLHIAAFWDLLPMVPAAHDEAVRIALRGEASDNAEAARKLAAEIAPEQPIEHAAHEGRPAEGLIAMSRDAAIIVMGARGLGLLGGALMGSVSAAVLGHATCPVVIVREDMPLDAIAPDAPVVVGIDGSDNSRQAAEAAFLEADARGVAVHAVASWLDRNIYASPAALHALSKHAEKLQAEQQAMLQKFLRGLSRRYPDIALQQIVSQGAPADALADAAQTAQLLVVGSHGRGGFMSTVLGSTSRALLHKSPCPLMVVRPQS
ncbi:MAG: universal stress protein [Ottowia sp.]|nr:universal stress protein [Ottowia sp.]